ncbi:indole-3-acetaldehyde oxidase [Scaptodrosophila lebanonensis]|uniref:Indole-3-acetaldehyde oxidase n=1 Tax=Drosophila lebanonensis TaxID=7225 RepID=A0A6J2TCF5_DROLE|nr:indole-3-acetaldehyde oxidase [Scaptodrosophila lebanonensis]
MTTSFTINGQPFTVNLTNFPPDLTLNTFIREHAQLTATKFMCQEGGCGACVCVVRGKNPATGETHGWAVNSCLTLLNSCTDLEIVTAEGLGTQRSGYHPIQKRLAKMNGTQCGYCSPGFVMNMYGLLESKHGEVTMQEVENSFGGNICRCTGYRPILDAMKSFAVDSDIAVPAECADIEDLSGTRNCPKTGTPCAGSCQRTSLIYADGSQWHWPKTLEQLFEALVKVEDSQQFMLVAGNTAHGVYRRSANIKHFIDVRGIGDLRQHSSSAALLTLGANLSLSEAMDILDAASKQAGFEYCAQVWHHFDLIANVPVRNGGTLAGNISIKKQHPEFPSDVFISFEALNVRVVVLESATKEQEMSLSDYLSASNRKLVLKSFLLQAYPKDKFVYNSYKIMPRAQNAHAYVNAAFLLELQGPTIQSARLCFGGIRPDFVHATAIEKLLVSRNPYDAALMEQTFGQLSTILQPDEVLPDASPAYRSKLACGLFYKFLLSTAPSDEVAEAYKSGANILQRPLSSGLQVFQTQKKSYPVTQAVQKVEGMIQCSGEATYMNDVLTTSNTVYCAFVGATKVGSTIEQIDATEALKQPGVLAFYTAKDVPGTNTFCNANFGYTEEEIFCATTVKHYDQPLGVVVALTADQAERATSLVQVTYSQSGVREVLPTMADVFDAPKLDESRIQRVSQSKLKRLIYTDAPDVSGSGIFDIGLQYHFTMEPQTTVVVPFEDGLKVFSATQWMDHTQAVIAGMLQVKAKDVQLQVRRLGGGYGGKITRGNQVACAAALAAHKLNRPVRFVQSIESMMSRNGKRWACRAEYEFHVQSNGKIVALKNDFYEDAGWTGNESPIQLHSTFTARNCYNFTDTNYKINGNAVLTDAPSSTWCRAPGSVEGIAMIEQILEHIAFEVQADPADVRLLNISKDNKMSELLPKFLQSREYHARRQEIEEHNAKNRWHKRGLGLAVMDYPIFYFGQYPATVAIYHLDGTVVVTHGGIEMGQGMNTKIAQVAAHTLGIELSYVKVESSDTINGANSMVTGGAVGSESLCFAVRKACETLNARLQPVKKDKNTWEQTVEAAYAASINLISSDHYKTGDMQDYHVYGLALTEIELDVLTGNNQIKRVDILEDAGESLSPYIDIGQIEGSFVMLLGYWLSEQLVYERQTGRLLTNRTWNYKVPGAKDIPIDFRIEMVQNPNPTTAGFMRSKATGEPPCCLAVSVIFALQQALQSARKDAGLPREWVRLGAPTTPETLVLNSGSDITAFRLK